MERKIQFYIVLFEDTRVISVLLLTPFWLFFLIIGIVGVLNGKYFIIKIALPWSIFLFFYSYWKLKIFDKKCKLLLEQNLNVIFIKKVKYDIITSLLILGLIFSTFLTYTLGNPSNVHPLILFSVAFLIGVFFGGFVFGITIFLTKIDIMIKSREQKPPRINRG